MVDFHDSIARLLGGQPRSNLDEVAAAVVLDQLLDSGDGSRPVALKAR
jgi:hypothetical protein